MIYHWCPAADWEGAGDLYLPAGFEEDGFTHCSFREQIEATAAVFDRGRTDLVLLCIEEEGLPVVTEDSYQSGQAFPHVYGPIPVGSIVRVLPFPPEEDGSFLVPEGV
jgi:uncharacterized protein (DUF952 family)